MRTLYKSRAKYTKDLINYLLFVANMCSVESLKWYNKLQ